MFLLVPAHLGCSGQSPESRKMVVCVCSKVTVLINKHKQTDSAEDIHLALICYAGFKKQNITSSSIQ